MFERPDPDLDTALDLAKSDLQQATQVLRIAAEYLKRQEKLPSALAIYLGDAFERAMKKPSTARGSELLANLNLQVNNRRRSSNFEYVGTDLEQLFAANIPKGEAILKVSQVYGVGESTVKRMYKEYREHKATDSDADGLDLVAELRHCAQKSLIKKKRKK